MSLVLKLEELIIQAQNIIEQSVKTKGKEGSDYSDLVINISKLNIVTTYGDSIIYVSESCFYDKDGYIFNFSTVQAESLCSVADYLKSL